MRPACFLGRECPRNANDAIRRIHVDRQSRQEREEQDADKRAKGDRDL